MSKKSMTDPDQLARMAATKALPGGLSHAASAGIKAYDIDNANVTTTQMVDRFAALLDRDRSQLIAGSSILRDARTRHESGTAGEEAVIEVAGEIATDVGAMALGPAGLVLKGAAALNNFASEKVQTAEEKLSILYEFATQPGETTPEEMLAAIEAKATDHDRKMIAHLKNNPTNAALDTYVSSYLGELAYSDRPEGVSLIEHLTNEINAGRLEKAVIVMDNPEWQAPVAAAAEIEGEELEGHEEGDSRTALADARFEVSNESPGNLQPPAIPPATANGKPRPRVTSRQ